MSHFIFFTKSIIYGHIEYKISFLNLGKIFYLRRPHSPDVTSAMFAVSFFNVFFDQDLICTPNVLVVLNFSKIIRRSENPLGWSFPRYLNLYFLLFFWLMILNDEFLLIHHIWIKNRWAPVVPVISYRINFHVHMKSSKENYLIIK